MPRRDVIAIEAMMRYEPAAHYDSGEDGIFAECRSCRFHRPYAADQTCVYRDGFGERRIGFRNELDLRGFFCERRVTRIFFTDSSSYTDK